MTQEQLLSLVNSGNFQLPTAKDDSILIRDNKYLPGIPLYKKEYQGTVTYVAVFGTEIPRLGINALTRVDDAWYVIPVVGDITLLKKLRSTYSKCMLLSGFASSNSDADKLVSIMTSLSTPLDFQGTVEKKLNSPTKRFATSYTVKLSKNAPFSADLDASLSLLSTISWDDDSTSESN